MRVEVERYELLLRVTPSDIDQLGRRAGDKRCKTQYSVGELPPFPGDRLHVSHPPHL